MALALSDYGNIDCRKKTPDGYCIVYDMLDSNSDGTARRCQFWDWVNKNKVEHYDALVGFDKVASQYFSQSHFSKPAHYRPRIEVLIPERFEEAWLAERSTK